MLFDGWEDSLKRSLYELVAAIVGKFLSIISLDDVSGERETALNHLETIVSALEGMAYGSVRAEDWNLFKRLVLIRLHRYSILQYITRALFAKANLTPRPVNILPWQGGSQNHVAAATIPI